MASGARLSHYSLRGLEVAAGEESGLGWGSAQATLLWECQLSSQHSSLAWADDESSLFCVDGAGAYIGGSIGLR